MTPIKTLIYFASTVETVPCYRIVKLEMILSAKSDSVLTDSPQKLSSYIVYNIDYTCKGPEIFWKIGWKFKTIFRKFGQMLLQPLLTDFDNAGRIFDSDDVIFDFNGIARLIDRYKILKEEGSTGLISGNHKFVREQDRFTSKPRR